MRFGAKASTCVTASLSMPHARPRPTPLSKINKREAQQIELLFCFHLGLFSILAKRSCLLGYCCSIGSDSGALFARRGPVLVSFVLDKPHRGYRRRLEF